MMINDPTLSKYLAAVGERPRLSFEEEKTASPARLVAANLRLVVHMAKKIPFRDPDEFWDRIQDGNIGLITAAEKFDSSKGVHFATYAVWWIRSAMQDGFYRTRHIVSGSMGNRVYRPKAVAMQKSGMRNWEIAEALGMEQHEIGWMLDSYSENIDDHDVEFEHKGCELDHVLAKAERVLSHREKFVLYGMLSDKSNQKIADDAGVARFKVEQAKASLIEKLKSPIRGAI